MTLEDHASSRALLWLVEAFILTASELISLPGRSRPLPCLPLCLLILLNRKPSRKHFLKTLTLGTSLVVLWLRLCAPDAGALDSIPGQD